MDAAFWNHRYAGNTGPVFEEAPNAKGSAMAARIPARPVLCLAEDEGRNAVYLDSLGHTGRGAEVQVLVRKP